MDKKILKVTKPAQFDRLIGILQEQPDLARGKGQFGSTKKNIDEEWQKIALELNSIGPPSRTGKEWQRVWVHYKANLKRKLAKNKQSIKTTGGGPSEQVSISQMEESVIGLVELQSAVNPTGSTFGFNQSATSQLFEDENASDEENVQPEGDRENPAVASTSAQSVRTPNRRMSVKSIEEKRIAYLKTQTENQTSILKTIREIEKVIYRNYALNKKAVEIHQKALELQKKTIELKKKQFSEASELHDLNVQLKKKKIELIDIKLRNT